MIAGSNDPMSGLISSGRVEEPPDEDVPGVDEGPSGDGGGIGERVNYPPPNA